MITTKTKKTQKAALLAYMKRNRKKGITSLEAAKELNIVCVHKRISELENSWEFDGKTFVSPNITRTKERTASGSIVTRYKLAR